MKSLASRQPFREMLRTHARHVLIGSALLAGTGCFNGLFFSHLPAYLSTVLKHDPRQAVFSQTIGVLASAFGILVTGWIGDRIPPRYLLRTGVILLMVLALPFYGVLEGRTANLTLVCILAGLCAGLTNGSFAVLLTDLFPTRIRFTGVALIFNVSFTLFSGMAPLAATTPHPGNRPGGLTGIPDDGDRPPGAGRESLGGAVRRERAAELARAARRGGSTRSGGVMGRGHPVAIRRGVWKDSLRTRPSHLVRGLVIDSFRIAPPPTRGGRLGWAIGV